MDILSVAAGKTKDLVDQYHIHSCPDRYHYKKTKYITFRAGGTGEMDALYEINKILIIPPFAKDNFESFQEYDLNADEVQRLTNYIQRNPFPENDRYYVLTRVKELTHKPRPREVNVETLYYSLDEI